MGLLTNEHRKYFSVILHLHAWKSSSYFCGMDKRASHSITMLILIHPVRGEGSAQWPKATSICVTENVFVYACVHVFQPVTLLHTLLTGPALSHTLQSHLLTGWQPTLPHRSWTQCPACWGSHQSAGRALSPLGHPSEITHPRHLLLQVPPFSLIPHPRVLSSTLATLSYSCVYISCQLQ